MKKALSIFLAVLVGGYFGIFTKVSEVLAQEPQVTVDFQAFPYNNPTPVEYLNAGNTGFAATVTLAEGYEPYSLGLFLDDHTTPVDEEHYVGLSTYTLTSQTNSLAELKSLLQYDIPCVPKEHILYLKVLITKGGDFEEVWQYDFTADFDLPTGTITSTPTTPDRLIIGDIATFTLTLNSVGDDNSDITVAGKYNERELTWSQDIDPSKFTAVYTVEAGDPDRPDAWPISGVTLTDRAGNSAVLGSTNVNFTIDANAPMVTIVSPVDGKSYNQNQVLLDYTVDDPTATVDLTLGGSPLVLANQTLITDLQDGQHTLVVEATDPAGNTTTAASTFTVDTVVYFSFTAGPDGSKIEQGNTIIFEGTAEPRAQIKLEIYSDPLVWITTADQTGYWRFEISSSDLGIGSHDAFITIVDLAGNSSGVVKVAIFEVAAKPVVSQGPITVAQAEEVVATDISVAKCAGDTCKLPPQEVAKEGQILSSEDTNPAGINWSAWIILLAIIVLASALATASYYGYGWALQAAGRTKTAKIDDLESRLSRPGELDALIQAQRKKSIPPEKKIDEEEEPPTRPQTRW